MKNPFNSIVLIRGEYVTPTRQTYIGTFITSEDPDSKKVTPCFVWNTTGTGIGSSKKPCPVVFKKQELDHYVIFIKGYAKEMFDGDTEKTCDYADSTLTLTLSKRDGVFKYESFMSFPGQGQHAQFAGGGSITHGGDQVVNALNDLFSY